jgi:hypothetical protein
MNVLGPAGGSICALHRELVRFLDVCSSALHALYRISEVPNARRSRFRRPQLSPDRRPKIRGARRGICANLGAKISSLRLRPFVKDIREHRRILRPRSSGTPVHPCRFRSGRSPKRKGSPGGLTTRSFNALLNTRPWFVDFTSARLARKREISGYLAPLRRRSSRPLT